MSSDTATARVAPSPGATLADAAHICDQYCIGCHKAKLKTLVATVESLAADYSRPYQIFLGGPTNTRMSISDGELAAAADLVQRTGARVFVHSQYIINLCNTAETWHKDLLAKNLRYAVAAGFKGVVVHVGKSTKTPLPVALEAMRTAIREVLPAATPDCPLLLETPAGQGTETLRAADEFIEFVKSFADPRLRICLDTCHVFAAGHKPLEYLRRCVAASPPEDPLLRLVHYNDSAAACGSCVDRHAFVGTGHIGLETMRSIAEFCDIHEIPMVIE